MEYSGVGGGGTDSWKKPEAKISWHCPFNSTIQRCPNKIITIFLDWRFFSFTTGVNDTGGQPWAANMSANFRKISKRP